VEVLEHAGYQVTIPEMQLCCGRPLYDFGMLDSAKYLLEQALGALRPQIAAGIPVIGLEPSCVSVFRDEMVSLLAHNKDAARLKQQTFLLSEFLVKEANYHPPQLKRKALVHGHCHHKSILKFDSEQELLKRLGLDFQVLDSGCCGMAGSFGFEAEKYDVSVKVGERVLLPAIRNAGSETLIIADGFSCFEQIEGLAGRKSLHIAEVLQMAIRSERGTPGQEEETETKHATAANLSTIAMVGASALLAGGALYLALNGKNGSHNGAKRSGKQPVKFEDLKKTRWS
jgi:Fe-S oxidoreductase